MCGIVGVVAERDIVRILIEGLHRLEYRGYDSAGLACVEGDSLKVLKCVGKVKALEEKVAVEGLRAHCGVAHTRWATHGRPLEVNAHPHCSGDVAMAHNGIIENHKELRAWVQERTGGKAQFASDTDSEVVAHLISLFSRECGDLRQAVRLATEKLEGSYALVAISRDRPDCVVGASNGSPLVVGVGIGETFLASDSLALRPVTDRFAYMDDGDVVEIDKQGHRIYDSHDRLVEREVKTFDGEQAEIGKGNYSHYMRKEIFEQPHAVEATLRSSVGDRGVIVESFGVKAPEVFGRVQAAHIVACGTSYYAGLVAGYWMERLARIPCRVEVGSEYRYRKPVVAPGTLLVCVSQSGETADTLAAANASREAGEESPYLATQCICNVADSSLVRQSEMCFITRAGPEIGVASTKAFTSQLVALMLLVLALGRARGSIDAERERELVAMLRDVPGKMRDLLKLDRSIARMAKEFTDKRSALFLGRGAHYPVAMEGALKMKEISYVHAEAYPAGELKHGPLALVDRNMPVVVVAPNDSLLAKLQSSLQEVHARGGRMFLFSAGDSGLSGGEGVTEIRLPPSPEEVSPIVHVLPLQLLAYHTAVINGTDVDQPRNLAKSVTVE